MTARVPFLRLAGFPESLRTEIEQAVARVVSSGWYLLGRELEAFERRWADYVGAEHAVGVASGLDALSLSLRALGVGPGDEVIVPSNTYVATWLAITHVGATPVPIEPELGSYNIGGTGLEQAITPRTRVVLPVHLYGQPADLEPILEVATRRGLHVLEDAAQCHGARYRGKRIGAHGTAVAWSFYPTKNLGALGDGGAVTTNDSELAAKLRVLRNYGSRIRYECEIAGYNSRLEEIHAALLQVKLNRLDEWNARRNELARRYLAELEHLDLTLPRAPSWADPVWHLFVVRHARRDELRALLADAGIETIVHYPVPPHLQGAYRRTRWPEGSFPISERIHREVLSLPLHPFLTDAEQSAVIEAMRSCCERLAA